MVSFLFSLVCTYYSKVICKIKLNVKVYLPSKLVRFGLINLTHSSIICDGILKKSLLIWYLTHQVWDFFCIFLPMPAEHPSTVLFSFLSFNLYICVKLWKQQVLGVRFISNKLLWLFLVFSYRDDICIHIWFICVKYRYTVSLKQQALVIQKGVY